MADTGEQPRETESLQARLQLNSSLGPNRRERPPQMDLSAVDISSRVPLRQPQRKDSKGGLRGMFTRNKLEKAAVSPVVEENAPTSSFSERSMRAVAEASLPRALSTKRQKAKVEEPATPSSVLPTAPAVPTAKPSRLNLRSKSVKQSKVPSKDSIKPSAASMKSPQQPPTRTSTAWDPPPLFQAYPQAIKHAQLSASTLSADAILRMSNQKRNAGARDEPQAHDGEESAAAKKSEKAKSKHRRQISGSLSKADWTQKVFVLVTSGYLLQYTGDGSFDRLPEKMMQLGKDSVAFASDVIPGKHWVLQISQAMDADGIPAADSRSFLSRLTFRGADYRRSATSLLLILNSAEDMDSWLAVIRREIEALGGKKHASETGKPKPDEKVLQLKSQPSHRYLVQRHPDQRSEPSSPVLPLLSPPPLPQEVDVEFQRNIGEAALALARPHSLIRPSTGHQSIAPSVSSNDGRLLESLRNSSNRFSYMSSGQRTLVTSQGSSPNTSPTRDSGPSFEDMIPKRSIEEPHLRPNAAAVNERRRSMQTMLVSTSEPPPPSNFHRHSTYGGPTRPVRSHSPGTPNFSVPNSSTKRYSHAMISPRSEAPPMPTTSTRPRDSIMKGTRKGPPAALNMPRSLSPVKDSPKHTPMVFTPTESSFEMVEQHRPSVVDIPPRSPSTAPTKELPPPPKRITSLMPLTPTAMSLRDFQFPRQYSSMQTLREISEKQALLELPARPAPLPPAALSTPLPPSSPLAPESGAATPEARAKTKTLPQPVLANTKSKIKRPISIQLRPSSPAVQHRNNPYFNSKLPSLLTTTTSSIPIASPHTTTQSQSPRPFSISSQSSTGHGTISPISSIVSPSMLRVKEQAKAVVNRRSMPALLANGPPPAPPPNCALPPLPPGNMAGRASMSSRGSTIVYV